MALDRPRVVAIINATPDSFYAPSRAQEVAAGVAAAEQAAAEGADAVDIGGESTRPGAVRVPADEQIRRVVPLIEAIRARAGLNALAVIVDTTRSAVARAALDAGADAVNDVSAGREDAEMFGLIAERRAGLVLMHRLRPPEEDSYSDQYVDPPRYEDVVQCVRDFLAERAAAARGCGVARSAIVLDPGLGFGKTVAQNLDLIRRSAELAALGYPLMSALSRKSFTGRAAGLVASGPEDRLGGTLGLSVAHLWAGARLFRVHDVRVHVEALSAAWSVLAPPGRGLAEGVPAR